MALKPVSVQLLLDKHKSRSNIRASLELALGVPAACMVYGSTEIQYRQPGHLAEAPRPCSSSLLVWPRGPSVPLSPDTMNASGRAASVVPGELIHAEERWCDVQQFRHGVHKGV